jgi:hypothetical protein
MKTATLDDRRRLVMPPECPPNSAVTIQQLDEDTWLVRVAKETKEFKKVFFPVIEDLPDDPEWEKVERAFGEAAYKKLRPPEE